LLQDYHLTDSHHKEYDSTAERRGDDRVLTSLSRHRSHTDLCNGSATLWGINLSQEYDAAKASRGE